MFWKEDVRFIPGSNASGEGELGPRGEGFAERGQVLGETGEVLDKGTKFWLEVVMPVKPLISTCFAFLLHSTSIFGRIYKEMCSLRWGSSISCRCVWHFRLLLHPYFSASKGLN